ncbi:MAG: bifunctional deaminase-reductase protein [Thermoleophilia bacterium]|nr:bifunctional deaminase-reductase protein [Thermoleophilia bacterium]
MGRTVYWMNVSLDLLIERNPGEEGGGSWMRISESLHQEFNDRARQLVLAVEGRVIYETMEGFWPAAIDDDSLEDVLREYGRIWTEQPKVLVSRTRSEANHNTRVIGNDGRAMEELARIREETDGDIGVGGAGIATQMLQHGLLDELFLVTHPVILGSGRPLFDSLDVPVECDLLEQAQFEDGVTLHRYAIRH